MFPKPVTSLEAILRKRLEGATRLAVLAVGSELRGDDAAGLLAGSAISRWLKRRGSRGLAPAALPLEVFEGHTAPENLTGALKSFAPSHLVIIDAADFGGLPGHVELLEPDVLTANASMSTHSLSVTVLADYLKCSLNCQVLILGIQPATREFGRPPSPEVISAAKAAAKAILDAVSKTNK